MKIKAGGLARHHFWGDYSASIVLKFKNSSEALLALRSGKLEKEWEKHSDPVYLICSAKGSDLDRIVDNLTYLGAEKKKILSIAKSVDFGESFSIELDVEDPNQLKLFAEEDYI